MCVDIIVSVYNEAVYLWELVGPDRDIKLSTLKIRVVDFDDEAEYLDRFLRANQDLIDSGVLSLSEDGYMLTDLVRRYHPCTR